MDYGIENLKKLLEFIYLALGKTLTIDSNQDGKISFTEILSTVTTLSFKFPGIYQAFPFLKKEFKDLTQEELDELTEFVASLDLPEKYDNIEELIRLTINALNYNYKYVLKMKALIKPNA